MACFSQHGDNAKVTIPRVEERDKRTFYELLVEVGQCKWSVFHRYNEFAQLHEVLVTHHGVTKDILPPKKVLGNKEPAFIEKRRNGLELYMSTVLRYLQKTMPKELATFLDFHEYDILFLLQSLAVKFFQQGESLLMKSKSHTFTPLQLHAISERLKQPCPSTELQDQQQDFSHVLDYCSQITELNIQGSVKTVKLSNIIPNQLQFDLCSFKSLERLAMYEVNLKKITDLGTVRSSLKHLDIHHTDLQHASQILLCDQLHKNITDTNSWGSVINTSFSSNQLTDLDESMKLLPNLEVLNVENNRLQDIQYLNTLTKLKSINLSGNRFQAFENLELKLCKIVFLDLSQNYLRSLKWFSKLFSLETLDLKSNRISDVSEVQHVAGLPCLENLILTGNPVSVVVDYRVKVLELFGNRALEICLDNEKSNQKELDKVAVLQAIRTAKEGRCKINMRQNCA